MKIFELIQSDLATYGLSRYQHPFNSRNLLSLFIFSIAIFLNGVYLCCEARTFLEYTRSFFAITAQTGAAAAFSFSAWNMRELFECVPEAEEIINGSEFQFCQISHNWWLVVHFNRSTHFRAYLSSIESHLRTVPSHHKTDNDDLVIYHLQNFLSHPYNSGVDYLFLHIKSGERHISIALHLLVCYF